MIHRVTISVFIITLVAACSFNEEQKPTAAAIPPSETIAQLTDTSTPLPTATATATYTPTPTLTPSNTQVPATQDQFVDYPKEGYGPSKFPNDINPLTGMKVDDIDVLDRRPISIKVSNYPRGIRPQWGLTQADHVYEYYHEGGLTRFNAIFYGNDSTEVGPIRSARFLDESLMRMYKSVFGFGSGDFRVRNTLFYSDLYERLASISDKPCPPSATYPLCRTDPNGWNHLLTNTSLLSQHFTDKGVINDRQYLDGQNFKIDAPPDGESANSLITRYSYSTFNKWVYDPETKRYTRYQEVSSDEGKGEVFGIMVDRITEEPITANNVVILFVKHKYYSIEPEMLTMTLSGFGKAYVFRDGMVYAVNWARISTQELLAVTYDDGSRFPLKPGNTWFQVIGFSSESSVVGQDWRFTFRIP